ncbi:MAG TPA: zinc ribbon domain-containing protein [Chloroflexi bacterium]|nr:zinc ribbon domain-containing protein [Chloroflexota bacterium]
MQRRTYRGPVTARGLAEALVIRFNTGHLIARASGSDDHMIVQIIAREGKWDQRTRAALTISIIQSQNAVEVSLGEHQWLGPAADLLDAGLRGWFRPFSLLGELSEIAEDIQTLQLPQQVWEAVEHYVESVGAKLGLAEEDRMVACPFCGVGNPVGAGQCSACGGSLAGVQPKACPQCGKLSPPTARFCSRCGTPLDGGDIPS